jgi:hypothetical protein
VIRKYQLILVGVAGAAHGIRDTNSPCVEFIESEEAVTRINEGTPFVDLTDPARVDQFLAVIPRAPRLGFCSRAADGSHAEIPDYIAFWAANGANTSLRVA